MAMLTIDSMRVGRNNKGACPLAGAPENDIRAGRNYIGACPLAIAPENDMRAGRNYRCLPACHST